MLRGGAPSIEGSTRGLGSYPHKSWLRKRLAGFHTLRSLYTFGLALRTSVTKSPDAVKRALNQEYDRAQDPWEYESTAGEICRHDTALAMIHRAYGRCRPRAIEIGCGEGIFTQRLAPSCMSLLAIDISNVALTRARVRCAGLQAVDFALSDLRDGSRGQFQLVVCMDTLEYVYQPIAKRRAIDRVARMVEPGGHLVISVLREHPVVEQARWASWLGRGGTWTAARFTAGRRVGGSSLRLVEREVVVTDTHIVALYEAV